MADIKISALPVAGSLTGAETFPLNQTGTTKSTLLSNILLYITPWITSLYNGGTGNVINNAIATTQNFSFVTSQDAGYNPTAKNISVLFNAYHYVGGTGSQAEPGAFGIKTGTTAVAGGAALNFSSTAGSVKLEASTGAGANERTLTVDGGNISLVAETPTGYIGMYYGDGGAFFIDSRSGATSNGITYGGDYSTDIIINERSITDVGSVKLLRQDANTWDTAGRPPAIAGRFGFNIQTSKFEGYDGSTWVDFH